MDARHLARPGHPTRPGHSAWMPPSCGEDRAYLEAQCHMDPVGGSGPLPMKGIPHWSNRPTISFFAAAKYLSFSAEGRSFHFVLAAAIPWRGKAHTKHLTRKITTGGNATRSFFRLYCWRSISKLGEHAIHRASTLTPKIRAVLQHPSIPSSLNRIGVYIITRRKVDRHCVSRVASKYSYTGLANTKCRPNNNSFILMGKGVYVPTEKP